MIVIYPKDKTTEYLRPIFNEVLEPFISYKFEKFTTDDFGLTLDNVKKAPQNLSIFYLGHGSDEELKLNANTPLHFQHGKEIFKGKKLFFLSCFSADFIENLEGIYEVAIGFGNIIDSRTDLNFQDYNKYNHDGYRCIYQFTSEFVTIISSALLDASSKGHTYLQFYYSLKLRINKKIASCSLSKDKTTRLVGELMFDFKKNMVLRGNFNALLFE